MKKGIVFTIVIIIGCMIFSGCDLKTKNSILTGSRSYSDFSYIDANSNFKADSEATSYVKSHNNQCIIWTVPIKEISGNKLLVLQASGLSQVYANFDYTIDTQGYKNGQVITISGYLKSYTKSFLGEAPAWTLSNCRIEKTDSKAKDDLNNYVSSVQTSKSTTSASTASTDVSASKSANTGFSFTPEEFKTEILAKDNNFIVLPSYKSGSTDALDNLFYSYKGAVSSYSINLYLSGSNVSLIEYSQMFQSAATSAKPLDLMNDVLYVVYGNKENDNYNSVAAFVKDFYNKNLALNDYHTGTTTIGDYMITLVAKSKNQNLRMIIQPK